MMLFYGLSWVSCHHKTDLNYTEKQKQTQKENNIFVSAHAY